MIRLVVRRFLALLLGVAVLGVAVLGVAVLGVAVLGAGQAQEGAKSAATDRNGDLLPAGALARLGFRVHSGLNWPAHDITHSLIEFPPGQRAGARLVRTALPGAALSQTRGLARIRVVLGASGYSVARPAAPPATTASAGPRPAAGNSCR